MYTAVIFDLDGTLLDSVEDIRFVLNQTLIKYDLPQVTRGQTVAYIGNGAKELVRLAIGDENAERLDVILADYIAAYARSDNPQSKLFDGEREFLHKIKAKGIKSAILTNKPHSAALKANEIFFGGFAFDCIQGQEDGLPLKPAPQSVQRVLDKLGVQSGKCLFVGDGEADIQAAKNVGMDCVSVLWGYRTKEQLSAAGGKIFANNFKELLQIIDI